MSCCLTISSALFYYRNTSDLEKFNSLTFEYAPESVAFDLQYYRDRMFLTALDHNYHLLRVTATTSNGEKLYKREYCKQVKHWHVDPVKVSKISVYTAVNM